MKPTNASNPTGIVLLILRPRTACRHPPLDRSDRGAKRIQCRTIKLPRLSKPGLCRIGEFSFCLSAELRTLAPATFGCGQTGSTAVIVGTCLSGGGHVTEPLLHPRRFRRGERSDHRPRADNAAEYIRCSTCPVGNGAFDGSSQGRGRACKEVAQHSGKSGRRPRPRAEACACHDGVPEHAI
jgi:hypothetical protein